MKTCFSIMPFADGFEDIDRIVGEAAEECGLDYIRGDRTQRPGSILPQVIRDIRQAAVVVADITGHNPNVFYELGIAHQLKGPEHVVIITQAVEQSPYDVHEFRQLTYQHNAAGRAALREKLPLFLRAAAETHPDQEIWNVIRGGVSRTRLLIRDLRRLSESAADGGLSGITIRMAAGLGSFSISDHEPIGSHADREYAANLIAVRDGLRDVLLLGARLKAVLNPPRRFAQPALPERLVVRYQRMIGLLEGRSDIVGDPEAARRDVAAIRQCEFALSPIPMPKVFIIGEQVAYEGMKRGVTGGFEMTHCETNAEALRELVRQFDRFFEDSRRDMVRTHPPDGLVADQLRACYRDARPSSAAS